MKRLVALILILFAVGMVSCTQQQRAKKYGGSAVVNLPPGTKLLEATWKRDDLWYLIRQRKEGEAPQSYVFAESSSWGVLEGKITFNER
ncbi:MAG: hypothetical protein ACWGQW_01695 [bacterium]